MARSLSPLRPRSQLHREPREPSSPLSLQQQALVAVPNPGETALHFLPPWHILRQELENREYEEMREKFRKENAKKFRYVMEELRWVDHLNWTWSLFPSHVALLVRLGM